MPRLTVIGGGFAGVESAWAAANLGVAVDLVEMRPREKTPAHETGLLAEMVCSNSLKSTEIPDASGVLKREMRALGSLVLACADATAVPAGKALAVDRHAFAEQVTRRIGEHPLIRRLDARVDRLPDAPAIIATGPLTADALAAALRELAGDHLHFYDAMAPIVEADSIDMDIAFKGSRWDAGDDYLNCPMEKDEYKAFHAALMAAERTPLHDFEDTAFFEGCLPVEELAARGLDTLRFGPMKPVGLRDPRNGNRPWAVVQLRQDNLAASHYNMVGFQNHLKWGEQARVFRMIPGMQGARFVRFGVIHRNTYVCSPRVLDATLALRTKPGVRLAGQITGVEGYLESAASGILAGLFAAAEMLGAGPSAPPPSTMLGALHRHVTAGDPEHFAPMNAALGLLDPLPDAPRDKAQRRAAQAENARIEFTNWQDAFFSRLPKEVCS